MKYSVRMATLGTLLLIGLQSHAEDQKSSATAAPFEWSTYFDFYYQASPQGHGVTPGPSFLEGRVFDAANNEMTLNMVELSVKRKIKDVAFRMDIAAGQMVDVLAGAGTLNAGAQEPTRNITQATLTYTPPGLQDLSVTVGKFYTYLGYEVTKAKDNWQYSRSYTYNYGIPFWHEGAIVSYAWIPAKFTSSLYIMNAFDGRLAAEGNRSTTLGANLNVTPFENLAINYNYIGGKENQTANSRREIHEVNAAYSFNPSLSVAMDYILGAESKAMASGENAKWNALSLFLKYSPITWYYFSPRYELFDDSDQGYALSGYNSAPTTGKQKVTSWTITNGFTLSEGLELRLEARMDRASGNEYFKASDGHGIDHQESYSMAALFSF